MARQSTRTLRFSVYGAMAVFLLGGVLLAFWPLVAADRRLQAFCRAQAVGTPLAQLQAGAQARGYGVVARAAAGAAASGTVLVDDPAGFGRRQCTLALDAQGRVAAP